MQLSRAGHRNSFEVLLLLAACVGACGETKQANNPINGDGNGSSSGSKPEETKWEPPKPTQVAPTAATGVTGQKRADEYDKEATDEQLTRAAKQVKEHCGRATDENGKASGPFGKVKITIVLGRNGHPKQVNLPANFEGKPTGKCVNQAFLALIYPPWSGSDATVEWDIELVQPTGK